MSYSLETLLGWRHLTEAVEVVKNGLPKVVPDAFWTVKEQVVGDKARTFETYGQRKVARQVPAGAPFKQAAKVDYSQRDFNLIGFGEVMPFDNELITVFRQWDKWEHQHKWAIDQVRDQGEKFATLFDNARVAVLHSMLAHGAAYFDSDGNLLPDSSGASLTISQDIPAANAGTLLDVDESTAIVTASWATSTTNIVQQVRNLKALAMKRSGEPLKYAFYGKNVAGYIATNDSAKTYYPYQNDGAFAKQIMHEGKIPKGFMDLEWIPMQDAFFVKSDGTYAVPFPADQVTFTPEIDRRNYTFYEGTTLVPSQLGVYGDAKEAFASVVERPGMGRYAYMEVGAGVTKIFDAGFDKFLPRFKKPNAYFRLDTTP